MEFEPAVGIICGGEKGAQGEPISIMEVEELIFGTVLLNDWTARDIEL